MGTNPSGCFLRWDAENSIGSAARFKGTRLLKIFTLKKQFQPQLLIDQFGS
jgi:hypothetical protein